MTTRNGSTLFLVDGSNYVYRAFYAIRQLTNSKGFPTNAIYGFTTMLMRLCREHRPDYIVVVFDSKGPTFRHDVYENYKANRKPMPDELIPQIPHIKAVVRGLSIPVIEQAGMEADDIIGTLAKNYTEQGVKTIIVSGDKDLLQLVTDDVTVIDTMKDKVYDIEEVHRRFGVEPEKVREILGLAGDTSDNIPGVPGVGEKTALKLVREFGTIENILAHTAEVKNAKVRKNLAEYAEQARLSRDLATIRTDVPLDCTMEDFRYREPDEAALRMLFKEFEFSSLLKILKNEEEVRGGAYQLIETPQDLDALVAKLRTVSSLALDAALSLSDVMQAEIVGLSLSFQKHAAYYIPLGHSADGGDRQLSPALVLKVLRPVLEDESIRKTGHDIKNILIVLARNGIRLRGISCDVMVAAYILNPSLRNFGLSEIAQQHLDERLPAITDLTGSGLRAVPFSALAIERAMDCMCRRADCLFRLTPVLCRTIEEEGFTDLFYNIEIPLIEVLAAMEMKGVLLDRGILEEMSQQLGELLALSERKIYHLAGEEFNINSPKQLQVILFDKLGLPKGKKTKGGYSTDVEVLTSLAQSYELPAEILAYRSLIKLKTTYVDALPLLINPQTGRVHTSFNQAVTATGRLSSSNPNLQNIPIRTMEGKRIRQAFIAPEGRSLVSADYSQIELRILAHLSEDRALIEAFRSDEDIHTRTAADIFGVFPAMVNQDMRRQAKVINFGILYGMSPFGLSRELGISQKMAKAYINEYFRKFSGVKLFIDSTLEKACENGYVTTLMNRRRYLPEIKSKNNAVRQFAERMAVNTPIQGTAADLIKVAMLKIWRRLVNGNYDAQMILQVHDELVFDVSEVDRDEIVKLIKEEMEGVVALKVPLRVSIAAGRNWDEVH